ncbi:MAG: PaeR7I family type II restriction endonuclease [Terrimicrobiaceae bacterium]
MLDKVFNCEERLREALHFFWRGDPVGRRKSFGNPDQDNQNGIEEGEDFAGFRDMIVDVVRQYGPEGCELHQGKDCILPGFFQQTSQWDMVISFQGRLLAAIDLRFLCAPAFEKQIYNCCEDAIQKGYDFREAQGAAIFGHGASPFLGYFILVEDAPGSREPVKDKAALLPTDQVFHASSRQQRMSILCERMAQEQLYSCASVLVASREVESGAHSDLSNQTSFRLLLSRLAGHLASEADAAGDSRTRNKEKSATYESSSLLAGEWFTSIETPEDLPATVS